MKKFPVLLIVIASILWGTSAIFANLLYHHGFSPLQVTAMRGTVSAILMSIYVFISNKKLFKINLSQLIWFALGGLSMFLAAYFYYESMNVGSVSVAVMLMYTAPIFVMTYSVLFLGEKLTVVKFISIVLVLLGCALISGIVGGAKFNLWGVVTGLLSGISYSAYNIIAKVQISKKGNPLSASVYCYIFMALASFLFADIGGIFTIANTQPVYLYALIIGVGVFTVTFPYSLYTLSLKYIPVGTASALGIIEPMTATLFGVAIFGEPLGLTAAIGIVFIMTAVLMLSFSKE
jgi:drug/metabolite transporter (DMT)-like permease